MLLKEANSIYSLRDNSRFLKVPSLVRPHSHMYGGKGHFQIHVFVHLKLSLQCDKNNVCKVKHPVNTRLCYD